MAHFSCWHLIRHVVCGDPEHFFGGECARRKRIWIKKESWIKRKIRMEQVLGKKWEKTGDWPALFCECVFHVPVPESGNLCVPVFCFGSLPVFTKKSVSQKTGLSGHLCWWQLYGMFLSGPIPTAFRRGKGRCEGDAVRCQCSSWRAYIMKSRRN